MYLFFFLTVLLKNLKKNLKKIKGWKSEIISAQFCEDVSEMATKRHFIFMTGT